MKTEVDCSKITLTPEQCLRAATLLHEIIKPGDDDFYWAMAEAQELFGYEVTFKKTRSPRSFYGIHKPTV